MSHCAWNSVHGFYGNHAAVHQTTADKERRLETSEEYKIVLFKGTSDRSLPIIMMESLEGVSWGDVVNGEKNEKRGRTLSVTAESFYVEQDGFFQTKVEPFTIMGTGFTESDVKPFESEDKQDMDSVKIPIERQQPKGLSKRGLLLVYTKIWLQCYGLR